MSTRKHYLRPIAYHLQEGPVELNEYTGEPKTRSAICPECGETKSVWLFPPEGTLGGTRGCIACTQEWFRSVTAANVPGSRGESDSWKSQNLHLYYEQAYREAASAANATPIIRSFTIQELLWTYGNGLNQCAAAPLCKGTWVGLLYLLPLHEGGSHSLENVRPACRKHIREGAL